MWVGKHRCARIWCTKICMHACTHGYVYAWCGGGGVHQICVCVCECVCMHVRVEEGSSRRQAPPLLGGGHLCRRALHPGGVQSAGMHAVPLSQQPGPRTQCRAQVAPGWTHPSLLGPICHRGDEGQVRLATPECPTSMWSSF